MFQASALYPWRTVAGNIALPLEIMGMRPEQLVGFNYTDQGVSTMEDGLYTLEGKLKDPAFVDRMAPLRESLDEGL